MALTEGQLVAWRRLRYRARTDLLWLCNEILGYKKVNGPVHGPVISKLQRFPLPDEVEQRKLDRFSGGSWQYEPAIPIYELPGHRRVLILDPRSWYKTTINCIAHTIQWIVNYPDMAVMIVQSTGDKAQAFLNEIKMHFQSNKMFRELFPEHVPKKRVTDFGTKTEFTTAGRGREVIRREPTVMAGSIDKGSAGFHFDVMKFSDIVEQNNCLTAQQIDKVCRSYGMMENLLVRPDSWIDVEGTRYDFSDLYGRIIEADEKLRKEEEGKSPWEIHVRGCYAKETPDGAPQRFTPEELMYPDKKDERGQPISLFPEEWPVSELEKKRKNPALDEFIFASQQKNNPVDLSDTSRVPFPLKQMRTKTREEFKQVRVAYHTVTVDTADTQNDKSKFNAVTVCAWDQYGRGYVHDIRHGKYLPDELIKHVLDTQLKYRPLKILIEETAYVRGLMPSFNRAIDLGYFEKKGIPPPNFQFIKRENDVTKQERILNTLQPWYKSGELFFLDDLPCMDQLKHELSRFPSYRYTDIIDTLADQFQERTWYGRMQARPTVQQEIDIAFQRMVGIQSPFSPDYAEAPQPPGDYWAKTGGL